MGNPFLDARIAAPPYASAAVTARVIRGVLARAGETEIRHIFAQVRKNLVALRDERSVSLCPALAEFTAAD
jgi:hypothetical protein